MEKTNGFKIQSNFKLLNENNQQLLNNSNPKNSENINSNIAQSNRSAAEINKNHNVFSEYGLSIKESNSENLGQQNYGLLKKLSEESINDDSFNNTVIVNNNIIQNQNNNNIFGNKINNITNNFNNNNLNINNNIPQNNPNFNNINNNINNINNNLNINNNKNLHVINPNFNNINNFDKNNNWNINNNDVQENNPNFNNINNNINNNNMNIQNINNQNIININPNNNYPDDDPTIKNTRLSDLGKKSYLNSVLQCLGNIAQLKQFFLNEEIAEEIYSTINKKRLGFAIQRLFVHLNNFKNEIYKPDSILGVLQEKNIIFKQENYEINPNYCLNFILNELHDELNLKKYNNVYQRFNQYNMQEVIQVGKLNFEKANDSIITNTFSLFGLKEISCVNCGHRKYEFKDFLIFDLDLLGFFNKNKKNRIRICDCLDFATQKKTISNVYCESCGYLNTAESLFSFINTPEILIFMIDRGNLEKKLMDLNFYIDNEIGLEPYMTYKESNVKYELREIVSIYGNKYISFVKVDENFWYLYNDSRIKKVEDYDVVNFNSSSGIKHIPCILFYRHIKR